ncbi:2-hydroxychromene-2-carboxylate isomerase [Myxococcaceae bacterium GXIMD 01537]
MAGKSLEFFFDYMSPYSYLASTQVEALAARAGAELRWRPFLLGGVFKATGNVPPIASAHKAAYMFEDLQRWARHLGLPPFRLPESFPIASLQANRLGLVAAEQGLIAPFSRAVFRASFADGKDIGAPEVLAELARGVGMDSEAALARTSAQEIKDALRQNTDEAVARGSFGAPSFFVGEALFVGNDRLMFVEQALRAA